MASDRMTITGASWTPTHNVVLIRCTCGHQFERKAQTVRIVCDKCRRVENMHDIKKYPCNQI